MSLTPGEDMNLPRKRRAGTLKPGSVQAKSLKPAVTESGTTLPTDEYGSGTVLLADVLALPQRTQSSQAREGETEDQAWRRSPRLQGLSSAPCPEGPAQDQEQADSPISEQAEGEEAEQDLVITLAEGRCRGRRSGRRRGGGGGGGRKGRRANDPVCQEEEEEEEEDEHEETQGTEAEEQEDVQPEEVQIDPELDRDLENKSRQHRLTSANVRSIIHEVITNEHVVAMMKAAINETEPVPVFEPKMTRSKLKEVVEKGVVIPNWNISPIKKPSETKAPQFVDIPLEEEDSSDEEYCPDEDDEDETAEETLLESDLESTASSPRGSRSIHRVHDEDRNSSLRQLSRRWGHVRVEVAPMGPPPPPQPAPAPPVPPRPSRERESSFMEKLHAVDEELALSSHCMEPYQTLGGGGAEDGVMAFRTRSKRPLRDVPLEELEAELRAPDFTPDLYDIGSAHEDREWTHWLQGLMSSDMNNEEEVDDDDDPEYNFLADIDEPDMEDYRNDRAVRITKKEVNELMEELFETFQEEVCVPEEEEAHEEVEEEEEREEEKEEDTRPAVPPSVSILHTVQYENPLADVLNESYRTVREQLAALRCRRALLESRGIAWPPPSNEPPPPLLLLTHTQKLHLKQQVQQHVQLLTQVIMLCSPVDRLKIETSTARQFLSELEGFAQRGEQVRRAHDPSFTSIFRATNLQGALSLLEEVRHTSMPPAHSVKNKPTSGRSFPILPANLAWLMATRPAFMYPELLPHVSLDPAHHPSSAHKIKNFTSAEDCLIVLGHRHFSGTARPLKMAAHYLLAAKTVTEINKHVYDICHRLPNHVLSTYFQQKKVPSMPEPCRRVEPSDQRPPVEKDENIMPLWLWKSLQAIYKAVQHHSDHQGAPLGEPVLRSRPEETGAVVLSGDPPAPSSCPKPLLPPPPPRQYRFPPGTRYPPSLPERLVMHPSGFKWVPPSVERRHPSRASRAVPPHPKPSLPKRRQRLFTPTWRQEGKLQPIQPAPPPPSLTPQTVRTPTGRGGAVCVRGQGGAVCVRGRGGAVCVRGRGGAVCVRGRGGAVVAGSVTPTLGLGGLILNLPVSAPLVCPTPSAMPPALGLAPLAPQATPLAKRVVSQHCNTLMGLHKLPTFPLAPCVAPQVPRLVLVSPSMLFHNSPLLPRVTAPQATTTTMSCRSIQSQRKAQGSEVRHITTEEGKKVLQKQKGGGDAGALPTEREERTTVSVEEEMEGREREREEEVEDEQREEGEEEEEEEGFGCCEENGEGPFLLLSESSGSPAPSLSSCTDAMATEIDREDIHLQATEETGSRRRRQEQGDDSELERDDEETIERLSWLAWKGRCDAEKTSGEEKSLEKTSAPPDGESAPSPGQELNAEQEVGIEETPGSLSEDAGLEDDPRKETKDVAFAQAYLEKVCEALRVVPGKVEEFLGVLNAFEREPEGRSAVELYQRLQPLLQHWPELLQDFAAFLQPEQAHQCGLLAEQQAFERSQRFLRQLELSFGGSSSLYRKVVKILRGGTGHAGLAEIKTQISTLLGNHSHLLEEFWVFFHQLHPQAAESRQSEAKRCTGTHLLSLGMGTQQLVIPETLAPGSTRESLPAQEGSWRDGGTTPPTPEPVCAKNISLMPSGERVVLWTREADRIILTACQQKGANQRTFSAVSAQLGNKTANEVSARFHDLMRLFHTASRQRRSSEDDSDTDSSSSSEDKPD